MSAAFLVSVLLLGSPVQFAQDSVSVQKFEELEKRVEAMESRVAEHEAKAESFTDILSSQRWTFAAAITFVTVLVTVLFGFVGWSIFEWRAGYVEEDLESKIKSESSTRSDEVRRLEGRIEKLESSLEELELWRKGEEIRKFRRLGYHPMSLLEEIKLTKHEVKDKKVTDSEKIGKRIDAIEYDLDKIQSTENIIDFPEGIRAEAISELSSIIDDLSGETKEKLEAILDRLKGGISAKFWADWV